MSERIIFDYFKGQESEMLSFYRIPKLLFTNAYFKGLDVLAKTLYGLMLDRMSLSLKNKWFDEEQRAYIYFAQQEAAGMLDCMKNNTTKIKNIRPYLLATLFNAPSTMSSYYQAEVNHVIPRTME